MLRTLLSVQGATHAAEASYNNHWGVPLTLARLPADAAYCVVEVGMNHAGEILPLARLAAPDVAVITTVEAAHIGHLGSLEAIADEKASIAGGLRAGGVLVLPAVHPMAARLYAAAGGARIVTFGDAPEADMRLLAFDGDADGSRFTAAIAGQVLEVRLAAPGRHMAHNALAALAAAHALGADLPRAAGARAVHPDGRAAAPAGPSMVGEAVLLDESYNASGAAVRAALQVLALVPARRRRGGARRHAGTGRRRPRGASRPRPRSGRGGGPGVRLRPV